MTEAVLYLDYGGEAHHNMAFDECLLAWALARPQSLYFRLYTWREGAITFGFNQREDRAIRWTYAKDVTVIRRITGGRAIYHEPSELTYTVAGNLSQPVCQRLAGSLLQTSQILAEGLVRFLAALGLKAQYVRRPAAGISHPAHFHVLPCFAAPARHEIVAGPRKVVASAQRRLRNAWLQHGSVKLGGVVNHPAVSDDHAYHVTRAEALEDRSFREMASLFAEVMGRELGVLMQSRATSSRDRRLLAAHTETVRKKCLQKREPLNTSGTSRVY